MRGCLLDYLIWMFHGNQQKEWGCFNIFSLCSSKLLTILNDFKTFFQAHFVYERKIPLVQSSLDSYRQLNYFATYSEWAVDINGFESRYTLTIQILITRLLLSVLSENYGKTKKKRRTKWSINSSSNHDL